jgi:hypothetical protein
LGAEEDRARDLVKSLDAAQRKRAVVADQAPRDIITGAQRKAALEGPPQGLAMDYMDPAQQGALRGIIDEYLSILPAALARDRMRKINAYSEDQWGQIHFAWMGGTEPGQGHYYRIQGPTFLIEYDNIQNDANHSHTVWRDFDGDFGLDLLADHYQQAH